MKHLSQQDIDMKLRFPWIKKFRINIRERLKYPGLSQEHRSHLSSQMANLGKPKDYSKSFAPSGSIQLPKEETPTEVLTQAQMRLLLKDVDTTGWTKAQMVKQLQRQGMLPQEQSGT